ncbi:MAG: DUF6197 family protein [Pyrinomonadaceae bacterium]
MKVYELLNKPEKWTTGTSMRDKDGIPVISERAAYSYCLVGAIGVCYPSELYTHIQKKLSEELKHRNISQWNDESTYEEVISVCRKLDI